MQKSLLRSTHSWHYKSCMPVPGSILRQGRLVFIFMLAQENHLTYHLVEILDFHDSFNLCVDGTDFSLHSRINPERRIKFHRAFSQPKPNLELIFWCTPQSENLLSLESLLITCSCALNIWGKFAIHPQYLSNAFYKIYIIKR